MSLNLGNSNDILCNEEYQRLRDSVGWAYLHGWVIRGPWDIDKSGFTLFRVLRSCRTDPFSSEQVLSLLNLSCRMARIYDNLESKFVQGLQDLITDVGIKRVDFCVGYFNLRGWNLVVNQIDQIPGDYIYEKDKQVFRRCRLLIGMHQPEEELVRRLYSTQQIPDAAYVNDPELKIKIAFITPRTVRITMLTTPVEPRDNDQDDVMFCEAFKKRSAPAPSIKRGEDEGKITYSSAFGSVEVQKYPWRIIVKDAKGKVLTQTRHIIDNDSSMSVSMAAVSRSPRLIR